MRAFALILVAALMLGGAAHAVPLAVTTSGFLLDGSDRPITDPGLAMTFRIYNVRNAGDATETLVWESASCAVAVRAGFYGVVLGDECNGVPALADSHLLAGETRFLEVSIGGTRLSPRLQVTDVPRATSAAVALDSARLGGQLPAAFAGAVHRHEPGQIDGFDAQAVTALGPKSDTNALHHDRYTNAEAVLAAQGSSLFAESGHAHDAAALTGTLPVSKGGTGLLAGPSAAGQFLRASGAGVWAAATIQASDLPPIADRVSKAGDTMTGALVLPSNGLAVGASELVVSDGKVGIGTSTPGDTLHVAGSISAGGMRREALTRTIGGTVGDWAGLGTFASGTGTFVRVLIWGHWNSTLFVNEYDVHALQPYEGATTDWIQVAPTHGQAWLGAEENLTLDVRISAQNQPLELRVRRLTNGGWDGTFTASIETNANLTPTTDTGNATTAGTLATGYLGRSGVRFPVSTDRFGATTEGLFVTGSGNVGIGTAAPAAKLDVKGNISATDLTTTSPWYTMLMPAGWSVMNSVPRCRVVNGWIEFRGAYSHPSITGWPGATVLLLPPECRPQTARYTEMACHGGTPRNSVCNNDFYADGSVGIYTDTGAAQQRFEGVRIWAGAD